MILRTTRGEYSAVKKVNGKIERKGDDPDLSFGTQKLYVLDSHEWFDPNTSSHYESGISRHAMYGPAAIVVSGGMRTVEYHVNDPTVWAWVRRCINEGLLVADTMDAKLCNNEYDIVISRS